MIRHTLEPPEQGFPGAITAYAPEGWLWGGSLPSITLIGYSEIFLHAELCALLDSWPLAPDPEASES